MKNPLFYERQRLRISTWQVPQFLRSFEAATGTTATPASLATSTRPASVSSHPAEVRTASPPSSPSMSETFHFFAAVRPAPTASERTSAALRAASGVTPKQSKSFWRR